MDTIFCGCGDSGSLERLRYFPRQLLTADDMRAEQQYFREKLRRHNRMLHGWGVVCGLQVVADPNSGPMAVNICPGYALGPWGDEIYLAEPAKLDLSYPARPTAIPCVPHDFVLPVEKPITILVKIRYVECPSRPMRTLPAGCGCDETLCEYSRLRDGFELQGMLKPETSKKAQSPPQVIQANDFGVPPCAPCPTDPWVVLAEVQISKSDLAQINNHVRRIVRSPAAP